MSSANGFRQPAQIGTDGFVKVWRLSPDDKSQEVSNTSVSVTDDKYPIPPSAV